MSCRKFASLLTCSFIHSASQYLLCLPMSSTCLELRLEPGWCLLSHRLAGQVETVWTPEQTGVARLQTLGVSVKPKVVGEPLRRLHVVRAQTVLYTDLKLAHCKKSLHKVGYKTTYSRVTTKTFYIERRKERNMPKC